jgi:hypothetical protein
MCKVLHQTAADDELSNEAERARRATSRQEREGMSRRPQL